MRPIILMTLLSLCAGTTVSAQRSEGEFIARDFRFASGQTLAELRLHYTTLGRPQRAPDGSVRNAVLMLHGTTGSGAGLVRPMSPLFAPGELLDTTTHYIIFPDGIGHGRSSKPSDGLRMQFPNYTYDDMVDAQHRLLTEGLGVRGLRLIMGTSMGCMHAWVWGERYPGFADALVPLACAPTAIAGRNRMIRKLIIDDIMSDPEWKQGDYTATDAGCARHGNLFVMTSSPSATSSGPRGTGRLRHHAYIDRQAARSTPTTSSTRSRPRALRSCRTSRRSRCRFSPSTRRTTSSIRRSWGSWSGSCRACNTGVTC
jgi:homoserine O-acetyltransferase